MRDAANRTTDVRCDSPQPAKRHRDVSHVAVTFNAVLLGLALCCSAQQAAAPIADATITALQQELADASKGSAIDMRRACKNVIRQGEAILADAPDAANRFAVLAIVFEGQKRLLSLEAIDRNRDALFETCRKFLAAPDDYAELRFEADMLLSEKELAERAATVAQRIDALKKMLARYRGTPAERQSLKIASLIAPKLLAFDLEQEIQDTITERFGADHAAIEFRHRQTNVRQLDVVFSGKYDRVGGQPLVFPSDRLGHQYVVVFWSKQNAGYAEFLGRVKQQVDRFPGRFEVYSFNLDDLPDAGQAILKGAGLQAVAMRLPGGRSSSAYLAYARMDPKALLVNGQGRINLEPEKAVPWPSPTPARGNRPQDPGPGIGLYLDDDRYLAQLRSLLVGDFLVVPAPVDASQILWELNAIDACFTRPPRRFRLTLDQSLENYAKAEAMCTAAIRKHALSPGNWALRNRRIIALLGMWNLAKEPKYLAAAAKEATSVLAMDLPAEADIPARFCLAKQGLRDGGVDPEKLLAALIEECGGGKGPASALAAATILAYEANARTPYEMYRQQLLSSGDDEDPMFWPVYGFLRDKHHQYRGFHATPGGNGYERPQKYMFRDMVSGLADPVDRTRRVAFKLIGMDGQAIGVPEVASGEVLGIVFVEPPGDRDATEQLLDDAATFVHAFTDRSVKVMVAVLAEDARAIKSHLDARELDCRVGRLPDGIDNPLVQQLGILSADRVPNLLLIRPDGTVAWSISGLRYHTFGQHNYALGLGIESNIEKVRSDAAFQSLEHGDFDKALQLFDERLPPARKPDWWAADRYQGKSLAYIGLGDWSAALTAIDAAIEQRKSDFKGGICKCHGLVETYLTKAMTLDKLGRDAEAAEQRELAAKQTIPHAKLPPGVARQGVPVGVYYDWLKRIRLGLVDQEQNP